MEKSMEIGRRRQYTSTDQLPSGYRFAPTDREILSYFLPNKVSRQPIALNTIVELNRSAFYSTHPKDLGPSVQERERYYFVSEEDEEFQSQTTREVGEIGLWRITEPETQIVDGSDQHLGIGSKVGFTFFNKRGKTPKRTHWRMTEYRLPLQTYHQHNEWIVLAKISRGAEYGESFA